MGGQSGVPMADDDCRHEHILVTYYHPYGEIEAELADLKSSSPQSTRPVMTLGELRCKDCGKSLTKYEVGKRIEAGGDLFDERFVFSW